MYKMTASISTDGLSCKIETPKQSGALTASDLEKLIGQLASLRGGMRPTVNQSQSPLEGDCPATDATSPRFDLGAVQQDPPLVLLSIAFPQLGWRTLALTHADAAELGRRLLTLSATGLH